MYFLQLGKRAGVACSYITSTNWHGIVGTRTSYDLRSYNNNNNNNQTLINRLIVIESSKSNRFNPNHLKRLWIVWNNLINSISIHSMSLIYQMLS